MAEYSLKLYRGPRTIIRGPDALQQAMKTAMELRVKNSVQVYIKIVDPIKPARYAWHPYIWLNKWPDAQHTVWEKNNAG